MQVHSTIDMAHKHLRKVDPSALRHARNRLAETGIARLGFLLPHRVKRMMAAEALALLDHHRQWGELLPEGEGTARQRIDLTQQEVAAHASCIPGLYDCEPLRHSLSVITAEPVLPCPDATRYTVSRLHHDDAIGQWHWDDFAFALILLVECPPLSDGGFVQTVAHTRRDWDHADVYRTLTRNPIHSWELHPGDLYLMRADTTLHRVHPFVNGRRTTVSLAFASRTDAEREQARREAELAPR
ncbi:hypothetical protein VMT65_19250 [Nocardia sp. CDC153]|uniref:HalD/BesD family halogenase n=1 Tax=Nocardia sp. CDC153 TaxID=3112167 RepID=UPI002DB76543|nr:hypothetical protein [Nocardia sp. CDC153]MEC3955186.1 hypothetical protein [Nocardia sp. CDC153]